MHTGDTLTFQLLTWNYGVNAAALGLPQYPTGVSFELMSAPLTWEGLFSATLQSEDGSVSVPFGDLTVGSGYVSSSAYSGEVLTIGGELDLSLLLSEQVFKSGSAVISLHNAGADVTLGLEYFALRQDLYARLSGGPLSLGALQGKVRLNTLENDAGAGAQGQAEGSAVPEPGSGGLFLGGGTLLCGLSLVLARDTRGRG